jgi:TolA-binding protein
MNKLLLQALVLLSLLISCNSSSSKKAALSHDQIMANASRSEKNGWIVVHLEGAASIRKKIRGKFHNCLIIR